MSNPSFIVTRFTHGSAGKFLSTVLQTSDLVDHWSTVVQQNKQTKLFESIVLQYVNRSFPIDHKVYLKQEPMVPYNTDLYSVGYPRGNDVTLEQYISNATAKQDFRLFNCVLENRFINLIFNKPTLPLFCQNSLAITITVTTDFEKQWLFDTLWSKHFLETEDSIHYLPSDPDYCNFQSIAPVLEFGNQYKYDKSQKQYLYETYVLNNHTNSWYFEPELFSQFDKAHNINNVFISLQNILDVDKFIQAISEIFYRLRIGNPNINLIKSMHEIWRARQL